MSLCPFEDDQLRKTWFEDRFKDHSKNHTSLGDRWFEDQFKDYPKSLNLFSSTYLESILVGKFVRKRKLANWGKGELNLLYVCIAQSEQESIIEEWSIADMLQSKERRPTTQHSVRLKMTCFMAFCSKTNSKIELFGKTLARIC